MNITRARDDPNTANVDEAVAAVEERAQPLGDNATERLLDAVADREFVCLGEASHGTWEFYRLRARLTADLVRRGEAEFVAVEGDWTGCYEVNHYVKGLTDTESALAVLGEFDRWPTWMWANWEVLEFVEWLREHNEGRPADEQVGFYGMDVYSLFESMRAVVDYLEDYDPAAADRARDAYHCFEPYGEDARAYGRSTRLAPADCEDDVVSVLAALREETPEYDDADPDAHFAAEQNALVAKNAEAYYRTMVRGGGESWNVRDEHMVETLGRLRDHYDGGSGVVWAHNTHVGDARATDMEARGKVNVGQLLREEYGRGDVALVGLGTHRGSVVAGEAWNAPMEEMRVPAAREGSHEDVLRRADPTDSLLLLEGGDGALADPRGHRAIGVVYHPEREWGNYVPTVLPKRYDAFCFIEETTALHPLAVDADDREVPEAYPWGL